MLIQSFICLALVTVCADQAVEAAREYVVTGEMPTCLRFDANA